MNPYNFINLGLFIQCYTKSPILASDALIHVSSLLNYKNLKPKVTFFADILLKICQINLVR